MATLITTEIKPPRYYNHPAFQRDGMQYVYLGSTGAIVSRICLGLMSYSQLSAGDEKWYKWILTKDESNPLIKRALDAGINFFDTAEGYSNGGSEEFFGHALKELLPSSKFKRDDLFISTKILPARNLAGDEFALGIQKSLSRKAIFAALDGSLKRLQLDYIDLYFIHRFDPNTAPEETMHALHDLVQAGKIRYLGASSMCTWQFVKLQRVAERNGLTKFTVMQNLYNAVYREEEREMIPYCMDTGVACMPFSPLASGILSRQPTDHSSSRSQNDVVQEGRFYKEGDELVVQRVLEVAEKRGVPSSQIAVAWVLRSPAVVAPIVGATKLHHIDDAVKALDINLADEEIESIEANYQPHRTSGYA